MKDSYPHPIIAREGWPFLAIALVVAIGLSALGFWILGALAWLAVVFITQFFRDPPRVVRSSVAPCFRRQMDGSSAWRRLSIRTSSAMR
jgi:hypothetical protein